MDFFKNISFNRTNFERDIAKFMKKPISSGAPVRLLLFCLTIVHSGSVLIKCGQSHQKLGHNYKDFTQSVVMDYMQPLKSFLEGEMKSISVSIYFQSI